MAHMRDAGWSDVLMVISGPGTDSYAEAGVFSALFLAVIMIFLSDLNRIRKV